MEPSLQTLLEEWQRAYEEGCDLDPEGLCPGRPALADELRRAIEPARRLLQLSRPEDESAAESVPTLPGSRTNWETLVPAAEATGVARAHARPGVPGYEILE